MYSTSNILNKGESYLVEPGVGSVPKSNGDICGAEQSEIHEVFQNIYMFVYVYLYLYLYIYRVFMKIADMRRPENLYL